MLKIQAFLLSIIMLLVGVIYGDKPVEIDYIVKINGTEISQGDNIEVSAEKDISINCACENIGRPFKGEDIYYANVSFYKYVNGEKRYLSLSGIVVDAESKPILIRSGDKFSVSADFSFDSNAEAGVYSMEISVYDCKQIYENVLTVK